MRLPALLLLLLTTFGFAAPKGPTLDVGDKAPTKLPSGWIKGDRISAFDPKKTYVVEFWATWCGPCVAEIPNVLEQYEKYHDKGFEVVGISLDEDREALEKFVGEQKIPWPILYEKPEGEGWRHPLSTYYGISGIPTVILIGRDGNVITLNARGEKLGEQLDKLFKDAG